MDIYGKTVASIESTDDDKFGPNGGFTAVLSTPSLDRDGDRLAREEWLPIPEGKRYPLDMDHGMSVADTVGSFVPYWDGDQLLMDATFASTAKAQDVRALVTPDENGIRHIDSVSVAFMTDKSKKDGEPRRELLNAGVVAIPSNRDAVILASKAYAALQDAIPAVTGEEAQEIFDPEGKATGDEVKALLEALTKASTPTPTSGPTGGRGGDSALLQAIHDSSVHLGAVCIVMVDDDDTGADDGANKSFIIGNKSVIGTLEDLQCRIQRALFAEFPNDYPWPRATYLNDDGTSGTVVYGLGDDLWAASFTDNGADVEINDDAARPVGLITTLIEDPDGNKSSAEAHTKGSSSSDDEEEEESDDESDEEEEKSADMESFDKALDEVLNQESPAKSPEEPAPADKAAAASPADEAADDLETAAQALRLTLSLL